MATLARAAQSWSRGPEVLGGEALGTGLKLLHSPEAQTLRAWLGESSLWAGLGCTLHRHSPTKHLCQLSHLQGHLPVALPVL